MLCMDRLVLRIQRTCCATGVGHASLERDGGSSGKCRCFDGGLAPVMYPSVVVGASVVMGCINLRLGMQTSRLAVI